MRKPAWLLLLLLAMALPAQAQFADASSAGGPVQVAPAARFALRDTASSSPIFTSLSFANMKGEVT